MVASSTNPKSKIQEKVQSFINGVVVVLISLYQRYLSPLKGFSCAHRVLHGGESCSGYVKRMFLEQDLMTAISMSQIRFKECSHASKTLNTRVYKNEGFKGSKRRKFLQFVLLGFFAQFLTGYSKFECCYNPCACCEAYSGDDEDDD